jgi:hypothetical protein
MNSTPARSKACLTTSSVARRVSNSYDMAAARVSAIPTGFSLVVIHRDGTPQHVTIRYVALYF